jgi:hypothetical protein
VGLRRLERIFGKAIKDLTFSDMQALLGPDPVREDTDLDFKTKHYSMDNEGKKALASDVAAMANTEGGMIAIGVAEKRKDGTAERINPVEIGQTHEQWVRQVIAGHVVPLPAQWSLTPLPADSAGTTGVYLLVVPQSAGRPHAVLWDERLRYPRRIGADTRHLSEAEVADAYRNRFRDAEVQLRRLGTVDSEGQSRLSHSESLIWFTLSLVPNAPGEMELRHAQVALTERWLQDLFEPGMWNRKRAAYALFRFLRPEVAIGVRRLVVATGKPSSSHRWADVYGELHTDGSGFIARAYGRGGSPAEIFEGEIVDDAQAAVRLLVEHSARTGAAMGDCIVRAKLHSVGVLNARFKTADRNHLGSVWPPMIESDRTINLDDCISSRIGLLTATRLVLMDFFQAAGLPEVRMIDAAGRLRLPYFAAPHEDLERWAAERGVELVKNTLDEEA